MKDQTLKEFLLEQFGCAITAIYGDLADKPSSEVDVDVEELKAIAKKVAFYLDK